MRLRRFVSVCLLLVLCTLGLASLPSGSLLGYPDAAQAAEAKPFNGVSGQYTEDIYWLDWSTATNVAGKGRYSEICGSTGYPKDLNNSTECSLWPKKRYTDTRVYSKVKDGTTVTNTPVSGVQLKATLDGVVSKVKRAPATMNTPRELHATSQDPSWSELRKNGYDTGLQQTVLTPNTDETLASFNVNVQVTLNGSEIPVNIIVADGESAGTTGSTAARTGQELVTFSTDGTAWQNIENTTRPLVTQTGKPPAMWRPASPAGGTLAEGDLIKQSLTNGGFGTQTAGTWMTQGHSPTFTGMAPIAVSRGAKNVGVTIDSYGMQNVMIGVMLPRDFGDAPASYGDAAHLLPWTATGDTFGMPGTATAPRAVYDESKPYLGTRWADAEEGTQNTTAWTHDGDGHDDDGASTAPSGSQDAAPAAEELHEL